MINQEKIINKLKTRFVGKRILIYDLIDSTNLEALRLVDKSQAKHGDVIIAKKQFSGRGQQDHKWESPEGGVYLSIITATKSSPSSNLITFVSGISCINAIKTVSGIEANLKWVNDIIINKQKLGGILTETITRGILSTHISGIGINANSKIQNVSSKLNPVSMAELSGTEIDINHLIAEICNSFEACFSLYQQDDQAIKARWVELSNVIGLKINILLDNDEKIGIIAGINNLGHLIVDVDGKKHTLSSTKNTDIIYE